MGPLISIFTPVYNSEEYIRQCIESVLCQTLKDFEWHIYDDGSSDSSFDICSEYAKNDARIVLSKGQNGTSIDRMNEFIQNAKGKYIAFIDNDDYWDLDYLERLITKLEESHSDCAISSYTLVDSEGMNLGWYTPTLVNGEIISKSELKKRFLTTLDVEGFRWNKIYRNEIYQKSKAVIQNKFPADIRFEYELFDYVDNAVLVDSKGYYYRQSSGSEVAKVDMTKTTGMIDTFLDIGSKAKNEGLEKEGSYYITWRYINSMFLRLRDKKLTDEEMRFLFGKYPITVCTDNGLFGLLNLINKYDNKREGRIKFSIKAIYVWINALRFSGEK